MTESDADHHRIQQVRRRIVEREHLVLVGHRRCGVCLEVLLDCWLLLRLLHCIVLVLLNLIISLDDLGIWIQINVQLLRLSNRIDRALVNVKYRRRRLHVLVRARSLLHLGQGLTLPVNQLPGLLLLI